MVWYWLSDFTLHACDAFSKAWASLPFLTHWFWVDEHAKSKSAVEKITNIFIRQTFWYVGFRHGVRQGGDRSSEQTIWPWPLKK